MIPPNLPTLLIDLAVLASACTSTYLAWLCYRLVHARALLLFTLSLVYIVGVRVYICYLVDLNAPFVFRTSELVAGYWIIFPMGLWSFYKTLKKYCK